MVNMLVLQIGQPEFDPPNPQWKRESFKKDVLQLHMHTMTPAHHDTYTSRHMLNMTHTYHDTLMP